MRLPRRHWPPQGYRLAGPHKLRCTTCDKIISTNALARSSHDKSACHWKKECAWGLTAGMRALCKKAAA